MDQNEIYMNVKFGKTNSRSPSRAEPDVSYAALHFKTHSTPRVRTDRDGLNSTYSELNFRKEEPRIDEHDPPCTSSGCGGLSTSAQTGPHTEQPKNKIRNKPGREIWIICILTSVFIAIVAGLSIYVSQIQLSQNTSDVRYQQLWEQHLQMNRTQDQYRQEVRQLNSALESKTSENSRLDISRRACLQNLSGVNNHISVLEWNISSLKSSKAEICRFLSSSREQTCSNDWIANEDRCYYVSTFENSLYRARQECSNRESSLLEIDSKSEKWFVSRSLLYFQNEKYWIRRCNDRNDAYGRLYKVSSGRSYCRECKSGRHGDNCLQDKHRFICKKSAPCCPDIPAKIQALCQQPVEPT